jgi:toxin YoeB
MRRRRIVWSTDAWEDYSELLRGEVRLARRVAALVEDILKHPESGIGKPEALRHSLQGHWSRRITDEHRLVYRVTSDELQIAQARYHY